MDGTAVQMKESKGTERRNEVELIKGMVCIDDWTLQDVNVCVL